MEDKGYDKIVEYI